MYAVIITLNCNMGLRPRNEDGDDGRPTTTQTNKQYANTQRNKQTSKQSHLPNTTNPPGNWLKAPLCGNCVEIIIPTHHEIPRELVESSAVWKTVWKSLGIASGGGLWPEDDGEINNLTNNIGLWPQGEDDVPDVPSPADALHNSEGGMLVPYDAK